MRAIVRLETRKAVSKRGEDTCFAWLRSTTRCLCFGGGAHKGLSFLGAVRAVAKSKAQWRAMHMRVDRCAGVSIGSLVAVVLAAGADPWAAESFLEGVPQPTLTEIYRDGGMLDRALDAASRPGDSLARRVMRAALGSAEPTSWSLISRKSLHKFLSACLAFAKISPDETLGQLSARCRRHITLWATDGSLPVELSDERTPDLRVIDAVHASCALPGIFPPALLPGFVPLSDGCISTPIPGWNDPRFPARQSLWFLVHDPPIPEPRSLLDWMMRSLVGQIEALGRYQWNTAPASVRCVAECRRILVSPETSLPKMLLHGVSAAEMRELGRAGEAGARASVAPLG